MQAAIVREYGPPSVVRLGEMPDPEPAPDQVLVKVHACSLNPLDAKLRSGELRPFLRLSFPAVLGFDLAGEIVGRGADVASWAVGDAVYGRIDAVSGGTHAELAAVGADVIDRLPAGLGFREAASFPLVGMTAIQALKQVGLEPAERLLVVGAAGGVGSIAVQVGRAWGAEVTAVCRHDAAALVTHLGAARVLDYSRGELERTELRFDVVFDTVGKQPVRDFTRLLTKRGRYITSGFSISTLARAVLGRLWSRKRVGMVVSRPDGELMRELSDLVAAGKVVPVIDSVYPFAEIVQAHERVERGHLRGKVVVLTPAGISGPATDQLA